MRTNNLTSTALIALFCCLFSANAQAQFGKKFMKALDKTTNTIAKAGEISNKVENTRQVVNEWTGEEEAEGEESNEAETEPQKETPAAKQSAPASKAPVISKTKKSPKGNLPANNPLDGYTIKVLECAGNRSAQTVKITFTVYHELPDQALTIQSEPTKAFSGGIEFTRCKRRVGSGNSVTSEVPNKTMLQCYAEFQNITDDVKTLDKVMIGLRTCNDVGRGNAQKGVLEMKNIAIDWE